MEVITHVFDIVSMNALGANTALQALSLSKDVYSIVTKNLEYIVKKDFYAQYSDLIAICEKCNITLFENTHRGRINFFKYIKTNEYYRQLLIAALFPDAFSTIDDVDQFLKVTSFIDMWNSSEMCMLYGKFIEYADSLCVSLEKERYRVLKLILGILYEHAHTYQNRPYKWVNDNSLPLMNTKFVSALLEKSEHLRDHVHLSSCEKRDREQAETYIAFFHKYLLCLHFEISSIDGYKSRSL